MINIYLRILIAVGLGFFMGLEREYHHRYIGIRTVSLVTLACCLFCSVQLYGSDPTRIIGQVVTGMGFLGAGVIFKEGTSVKGMTTAATLWSASAIGSLVGLGFIGEAIAGTICVIVINSLFKFIKIERKIKQKGKVIPENDESEEYTTDDNQ